MPNSNAEYRWTKPKMARFVGHLYQFGSVTAAARTVGMSRQSAYVRARRDPDFCFLWDSALKLFHERRIARILASNGR